MSKARIDKNLLLNKMSSVNNGYFLDIDIDYFAKINETYGHDAGDKVLLEIPKRIKKILIEHNFDSEINRINGDEFAVILKNITQEKLNDVCKKMIESMKTPLEYDNEKINLSISIGISSFSLENDYNLVIENASDAMFKAKKMGRSSYFIN